MNKFLSIFIISFLILSGCKKAGTDSVAPKPVANFNFNSTNYGLLPTTVNFSDSSKNANTWYWDFGDGHTSTDKNPSNSYADAKTYSVKLVVSTSVGSDSITKQVAITLYKPKANFTFGSTNMGQLPTTINFTNTSTGASTYQWFFDNGDTSSKQNPSENYSVTKLYNVKLIAINAAGKDSMSEQVPVTINKSSAKQITSFAFLKSLNPNLSSDINGKIANNKISVSVLSGFSKNLVASFSSSAKSSVYITTTPQISGVNANDFSFTVDYIVNAEDGSSFTYSVDIQRDSFPTLDNDITALMTKYNVPGLSLAIVKNDKLVYMNSYGYADLEDSQRTTNENLFRIASVSKPVTAITILKLAEQGSISLNQTVFGTSGILGNDYGTPPVGSKIDEITINNLLNHTSGWNVNPNDGTNATSAQLVTDMVTKYPLAYNPGDTSIYLNMGYVILGRVIEKITSNTYENYVKSSILQSCGISQMRLTGNSLSDRHPYEVKYYNTMYNPYDNFDWTGYDAASAWIASPKDLARFIVHIDREPYVPDILNSSSLQQLYFGYYTWEFEGLVQGTNAILERLDDNFSFSIVLNHDIGFDAAAIAELDNILVNNIHARTNWPTYDLF